MPVEKVAMVYSRSSEGVWCYCPFCDAKAFYPDPESELQSTNCEHFRYIEPGGQAGTAIFYQKEAS